MDEYIAVEIETNGFLYDEDRIIEIAVVRYAGGELKDVFHSYVRQDMAISDSVYKLTGISGEDLQDAPCEAEVMRKLSEYLGEAVKGDIPLLVYNESFVRPFIEGAFKRTGIKFKPDMVDVMGLVKECRDFKRHTQTDMARTLGIDAYGILRAHGIAGNKTVAEAVICAELYRL